MNSTNSMNSVNLQWAATLADLPYQSAIRIPQSKLTGSFPKEHDFYRFENNE